MRDIASGREHYSRGQPRTEATSARLADAAFLRLHAYVANTRYRGYEFDDLLGSKLVSFCTFNNLLLQRIAVQVGEKFPLNLRPLLGIHKLDSTKARGFFAKGYLYYYLLTRDQRWLDSAVSHLDWLLENYSGDYPGVGWGNAFDFASRGGFFPRGKPTIVWTAHIAEAFELGYEVTRKTAYLEALQGSAQFITSALERYEDQRGICFAYAPGLLSLIFNSNLLGATTLLRWWKHSGDGVSFDLACRALQWTLSGLNQDGSWFYGVGERYRWIDNFHTAYNLDCLITAHEIAGELAVPKAAIESTYRFWTEHFFLADGTPRYYHNRTFPIDIQSAGQAIESLSKVANRFPDAATLAERVLNRTVSRMQKKNGAFRYQIRRYWANNLESIHWGQSTMLAALAAYMYFCVPTDKQ